MNHGAEFSHVDYNNSYVQTELSKANCFFNPIIYSLLIQHGARVHLKSEELKNLHTEHYRLILKLVKKHAPKQLAEYENIERNIEDPKLEEIENLVNIIKNSSNFQSTGILQAACYALENFDGQHKTPGDAILVTDSSRLNLNNSESKYNEVVVEEYTTPGECDDFYTLVPSHILGLPSYFNSYFNLYIYRLTDTQFENALKKFSDLQSRTTSEDIEGTPLETAGDVLYCSLDVLDVD